MRTLAEMLGQNIRNHRKARHISQDGFALMCNLDRSYMGRIERGEVNMTVEKLYQIALALGCQPAELLPPLSQAEPMALLAKKDRSQGSS